MQIVLARILISSSLQPDTYQVELFSSGYQATYNAEVRLTIFFLNSTFAALPDNLA
jgi:hypothetical protein